MCLPMAVIPIAMAAVSAVTSVVGGISGMMQGKAQAAAYKRQGKDILTASKIDAGLLGQRGAYKIGDAARDLAGTGNLSGLDILADSASRLTQDVDMILYGGQQGKAAADYDAKLALWGGRQKLFGGILQAAGTMGESLAPSFATPGGSASATLYGQAGRYGFGSTRTGSTGMIIGGL